MVASRSVLRHIWFRRTHRPLGPALEVGPRRGSGRPLHQLRRWRRDRRTIATIATGTIEQQARAAVQRYSHRCRGPHGALRPQMECPPRPSTLISSRASARPPWPCNGWGSRCGMFCHGRLTRQPSSLPRPRLRRSQSPSAGVCWTSSGQGCRTGAAALLVITAAPPCPDFSRLRSDAPGHGQSGNLFVVFTKFLSALLNLLPGRQACWVTENVILANPADAQWFAKSMQAEAIIADATDYGAIHICLGCGGLGQIGQPSCGFAWMFLRIRSRTFSLRVSSSTRKPFVVRFCYRALRHQ